MKIQRLYIGDFGILRNQTLDGLGPGLVVIGGPNRSGKTTFMQVLRYLGYGFPQGANLPPPTHEYHVEASVTIDNGLWHVRLTGHSKPRISGPSGQPGSIDLLFGGLDMFTYHQLFTISLDELRLLPEGVDKSEQAKLQSVLLGAGLAHVARLPKLQEQLEAEAEKIGGKNGNPSVRMFKPYYVRIEQGIKERDNALAAMGGYRAMVQRLAEIETRIDDLKKQQDAAVQHVVRMEILLHNYEDYLRWSELDQVLSEPKAQWLLSHYPDGLLQKARALREDYEAALGDYQEKLSAFRYQVKDRDVEERQEALLGKAAEIDLAFRNLSGILARIDAYEKRREEQQIEESRLRTDILAVDPTWRGDLECLDRTVAEVDEDQLLRAVREHELLKEAEGIIQRLQQLDVSDFGKQFRSYAVGAALAVVLGALLGSVQPVLGIGLVVAGVVGLGLYYVHRTIAEHAIKDERRILREKLQEIANSIDLPLKGVSGEGFQQIEIRRQQAETRLEFYRDVLGLTEAADGQRYAARLAEFRQLWQRYKALERQGEALDDEHSGILLELGELADLAAQLGNWTPDVQPTAASFSRLALAIEKTREDLERAKEVQTAKLRLNAILEQIAELAKEAGYLEDRSDSHTCEDLWRQLEAIIQAGEKREEYRRYEEERRTIAQRIRHSLGRREDAALQTAFSEAAAVKEGEKGVAAEDYLKVLEYLYERYPTKGDLEENLRQSEEASKKIAWELQELEEERADLRRAIASLDTDQTLADAQKTIDEARRQLEPLARKFAVYRVAALFLDTLYKQFLVEAKDSLLTRASEVFRELTEGEYKEILPMDDLTEAGFQVASRGGKELLPNALSRGTSEQLFLAVRLGRIQEIEPPLPVIFDDSLVNFDRRHAYQGVRALKRLAQRHQVFVLTCHPELVEMIAAVQGDEPAQYWQLDRGVFSPSDWQNLVRFLDAPATA